MKRIFCLQYDKLISQFVNRGHGNSLASQSNTYKQTAQTKIGAVVSFYRKYVPDNPLLLKKLPLNDVKNVLKIPCCDDLIQKEETKTELIQGSKRLREFFGISEKSVCGKCKKKDICKFFEAPPDRGFKSVLRKEKEREKETAALQKEKKFKALPQLLDLHLVLYGLYKIGSVDTSFDPNANAIDSPVKSEEKTDFKVEDEFSHITHVRWSSASILVENIKETIDDLINHNGIVYKSLLNAIIQSRSEVEITGKDSENERLIADRNEDPVTKLLEDLKYCKNRKERKRLLAIYNQNVGFALGEYSRIIPDDKFDENDEKFQEFKKLENMKREGLHLKENDKDANKQNTTVYSGSRFLRTAINPLSSSQTIEKKFTRKLNMTNAKTKVLANQANFALALSEEKRGRLESTNVAVPTLDYNRSVKYLQSKEETSDLDSDSHLDQFEQNVSQAKDKYSANLGKIRENKLGKFDRKLEKKKETTLLSLEQKQSSRSRLLQLEPRYQSSRRLESGSSVSSVSLDHKEALSPFESRLIEHDERENLEGNMDSKALSRKYSSVPVSVHVPVAVTKSRHSPTEDEIVLKRVNTTDPNKRPKKTNLEIFKTKNPSHEKALKLKQQIASEKKVLKDKHIYKAKNLYNNSTENLLFEKDTDISRSLKYEKKIKK